MKKVLIASVTLACTLSSPQNVLLADEANNLPTSEKISISTPATNNTGETTNGGSENELAGKENKPESKSVENNDDACTDTVTTTKEENSVNLKAKMEASDGTESELNKEKTKSPYNKAHDHTNPDYEKFYGAGDMEFNYWTNKTANQENIRVNFATDYKIDGAKLEVGLPYGDLNTLITNGKLKISNASKWLTERLYRNESGYDTIDPNVIPDYVIEANKIIFNLGKLEARTAGSIQFHRTFDTNEEFNNAIKDTKATAEMKGKWNFDNLVLPGNSTTYKYKINENKENTIDEKDYKSDQKVFYNEDGTPTKNGYIVGEDISIVKQGKDGACDIITVEKKINDKVNLNASAKIDTRLKDYSNNGYTEKITNENNHSITTETEKKAAEKLSGPGNLEVQHWQDGPNESTKQQHWRFVFATDYAIQNGKITVKLPYELKDNYTIEDTTDWLVNRYYPVVTGKKFYSDLNVVNKDTYKSKIQIDGDKLTIDVGDIPARTAFSFTVHKKFDTPQDFSNDIKEASINVSGNWRLDEKYIKLPTTKISHDIKCGTCELPNVPVPNRPTPNKPEKPKNPEPNKPVPNKPQVTYNRTKVSENSLPDTNSNIWSLGAGGVLSLALGFILSRKKKQDK
ncbi:LPXTG cell wall anchor domain-containing protein [Parvimonas sp. G1641]|uniref:LPXTG cell wall anchor domain-containing protein n=1 Tax=Parvimonas sp. G1641 TaxID=3388846 RepID=UPI003981344F